MVLSKFAKETFLYGGRGYLGCIEGLYLCDPYDKQERPLCSVKGGQRARYSVQEIPLVGLRP